jgi:hypothetical protein
MTAVAAAKFACGPQETQFEAKADARQHPTPQPSEGKALVYVTQDFGHVESKRLMLTRVAADGRWIGANHGDSYIFFEVDPGEHHLCVNWQSRLSSFSKSIALANFTADEGKTYYFRLRTFAADNNYIFELNPANVDEGKLLVALSAYSVSHPKGQPAGPGK